LGSLWKIFLRRGFFNGWDEKKFRTAGIPSVSQKEIDALQAAMGGDEYKTDETNKRFDDLRTAGHGRASLIRQEIMIGVQGRNQKGAA
jgi:hypothetical protein